MTTFDDRQKNFETEFQKQQELLFKIKARRNKLFGLWLAEQIGLTAEKAQEYANGLIEVDYRSSKDTIIENVRKDIEKANLDLSDHRLEKELDLCFVKAKEEVMKS